MPKKKLKGTIISNKMLKTLVVRVEKIKEHPKYKRKFKTHKNYKAHYESLADEPIGDKFNIGDKVIIEETKPISKDKAWKVISKI